MGEGLFYTLSKILAFAIIPHYWPVIAIWAGIVFWVAGWRILARMGFAVSALIPVAVMVAPVDHWLLRGLEDRFAANPQIASPAGLVMMTGGEQAVLALRHDQVAVNAAGDRILALIALAHRHPEAMVLITGGQGRRDLQALPLREAEIAARAVIDSGIAPERVITETQSRNSAESAQASLALVQEIGRAGDWVLVTSAAHMPRAVMSFCTAGWQSILPFPVDFTETYPQWFAGDYREKLTAIRTGLHERIGALVYDLTGRLVKEVSTACLAPVDAARGTG